MVGQVAKEPIETNNHKSCLVHIVLAPIIDIEGGCLRFHLGRIIGTLKMPPVYTIDPSSCQSQFTGFNAVIGKGEQSLNVDLGKIFFLSKYDQTFRTKRNSRF